MPLDPGLDVTHLLGAIAGLIRASVLGTLTEAQRQAMLALLDGPARQLAAQGPTPDAWVPTGHLAAFLAAARQVSPVRTERARAQLQADLVLDGEGGPASPEALVAGLPGIYAEVHRGGRVFIGDLRPRGASVILVARYPYPEWYSEILPRWLLHALTRSGASGAAVAHHPPAEGEDPWRHRYELSW